MSNNYLEVQTKLFDIVKESEPEKAVEQIAELLSVSTDSAYRRLRNEKIITLDEVIKICRKYKISFDDLIRTDSKSTVCFSFNFKDSNYNFTEYLETIYNHLEKIKNNKGILYYSAKDIPVFHFFQSKKLTAFKVFYWLKTMSNNEELTKREFNFEILPPKILELTKRIYTLYSQIDSHEIWNYETIHSTTSQIKYYWELEYISSAHAIELLDDLKQTLQHLQKEAEQEKKSFLNSDIETGNESNFKLYFNEILAADNSIYTEYGDKKESFKPHIMLNYMITNNKEYCNYTKSIFENVIKKSTLISGVNEKDRNRFFNYNYNRIKIITEKIKIETELI